MRHWRPDRRGYHHGNLREALVEAARRFIAERGLGGFTLVDAARLVGVSPAALYRHFRGREALVAEVAERGFKLFADRLAAALRGGGDPVERFSRMGEAYLAFAREEPGFYTAMFSAEATAALPPPERTESSTIMRHGAYAPEPGSESARAFELLVSGLTRAFPEGLGGTDPRIVALQVWALCPGVASLAGAGRLPGGPGAPDAQAILRAGVLALAQGVERAGAQSRPR